MSIESFRPWESYPALTLERLATVARIIKDVRRDTALLHDPAFGDDTWCLGCRSYSRIRFAIGEASLKHDWLRILPESAPLRFTFTIGGIPIRFYHGDPEDAPKRYLTRTFAELHQQRLALDFGSSEVFDSVLRLAYELDERGHVSTVALVRIDDTTEEPLEVFEIPADFPTERVIPMQVRPIDLPPVLIDQPNSEESTGEANVAENRSIST